MIHITRVISKGNNSKIWKYIRSKNNYNSSEIYRYIGERHSGARYRRDSYTYRLRSGLKLENHPTSTLQDMFEYGIYGESVIKECGFDKNNDYFICRRDGIRYGVTTDITVDKDGVEYPIEIKTKYPYLGPHDWFEFNEVPTRYIHQIAMQSIVLQCRLVYLCRIHEISDDEITITMFGYDVNYNDYFDHIHKYLSETRRDPGIITDVEISDPHHYVTPIKNEFKCLTRDNIKEYILNFIGHY